MRSTETLDLVHRATTFSSIPTLRVKFAQSSCDGAPSPSFANVCPNCCAVLADHASALPAAALDELSQPGSSLTITKWWNGGCDVQNSKTNTDPEKVEWQLSVDDSIEVENATTEEQPFVAPLEFGHEDFVHDWTLTPHAAV
jgi:hypothetical protein